MIKLLAFILLQFNGIPQKLIQTINDFEKQPAAANGIVSVSIRNIENGKVVFERNGDKSVNSASIMKLVSTGAILQSLGEDYQFPTYVKYTGVIDKGILSGDLIIESSGDPSLGSPRYPSTAVFLQKVVQAVKQAGIKTIEGRIKVIDPDFFSFDHPDSWIYGDMGNYYGAIPHQFNYHENYYTVSFKAPYEENQAVQIRALQPNQEDWKIINTVTAGPKGSGDQVYIYTSPASNDILMKGTVPKGVQNFPVKGSIQHPAKLFLEDFQKSLINEGITLSKNKIDQNSFFHSKDETQVLYTYFSPTLKELIKDCNFQSINLYADAFAQKLATIRGKPYHLSKGAEEMKAYWESWGLQLDGFEPKDGSGLSPSGLVTGNTMTNILISASKSDYFESFLASIPILGQSGTVRYLDRSNITKGRVHTKSGSIEGTRSYSGYVTAKNDKMYAFSLIVNRYKASESKRVRSFLENILIQLIDLNQ